MALRDPVAVYNAANNLEAIFVRDALTAAGVEAYVTEDVSQVGVWAFGLIPEIHKPQVWVDRADVERVNPLLDSFERRAAELRGSGREGEADGSPVETVCEECGHRSSFPASQRGSVQQCPQCGAYLDVGEEEMPADEEEGEAEAD
jgi:hypothetical protein